MPINDPTSGPVHMDEPVYDAVAITPSDSTDLTTPSRALYIGTGGDLKVDMVGGGTVTFSGTLAGTILAFRVSRVYSTGTTASNIIALY